VTFSSAKFTINDSPSASRGFDAVHGQTLTLRLEALVPAEIWLVRFEAYYPGDPSGPFASKDAPVLSFEPENGIPDTPDGAVTVVMPAEGCHSFALRCIVNQGVDRATGAVVLDWTFERIVAIRNAAGLRKTLPDESTQYHERGWSDAINEMVDVSATPSAASIEAVTFEALQAMRNADASVQAAFMLEQVGTSCNVETLIQPGGMYQWKAEWTKPQSLPQVIQPGFGTDNPLGTGRWYRAPPDGERPLHIKTVASSYTLEPPDDVLVIDTPWSDITISLSANTRKAICLYRLPSTTSYLCTVSGPSSPGGMVNGHTGYTCTMSPDSGLWVISLDDTGQTWLALKLVPP